MSLPPLLNNFIFLLQALYQPLFFNFQFHYRKEISQINYPLRSFSPPPCLFQFFGRCSPTAVCSSISANFRQSLFRPFPTKSPRSSFLAWVTTTVPSIPVFLLFYRSRSDTVLTVAPTFSCVCFLFSLLICIGGGVLPGQFGLPLLTLDLRFSADLKELLAFFFFFVLSFVVFFFFFFFLTLLETPGPYGFDSSFSPKTPLWVFLLKFCLGILR